MIEKHALIAIAVMTLVTVFLRFAPFLFLAGKEELPYLKYLGKMLPSAIMGMLVVYCFKDTDITVTAEIIPALLASLVIVLIHALKKNTLLSILSGSLVYILLVNYFF